MHGAFEVEAPLVCLLLIKLTLILTLTDPHKP